MTPVDNRDIMKLLLRGQALILRTLSAILARNEPDPEIRRNNIMLADSLRSMSQDFTQLERKL